MFSNKCCHNTFNFGCLTSHWSLLRCVYFRTCISHTCAFSNRKPAVMNGFSVIIRTTGDDKRSGRGHGTFFGPASGRARRLFGALRGECGRTASILLPRPRRIPPAYFTPPSSHLALTLMQLEWIWNTTCSRTPSNDLISRERNTQNHWGKVFGAEFANLLKL